MPSLGKDAYHIAHWLLTDLAASLPATVREAAQRITQYGVDANGEPVNQYAPGNPAPPAAETQTASEQSESGGLDDAEKKSEEETQQQLAVGSVGSSV